MPLYAGFKNTFNQDDNTILIHFKCKNVDMIVHSPESFEQNYIRVAQSFGIDIRQDDVLKHQDLIAMAKVVDTTTYMVHPYISNLQGLFMFVDYYDPSRTWSEMKDVEQESPWTIDLLNSYKKDYIKASNKYKIDVGIPEGTHKFNTFHEDRTVYPRLNFSIETNELWVDLLNIKDQSLIQSLPLEFTNRFEGK